MNDTRSRLGKHVLAVALAAWLCAALLAVGTIFGRLAWAGG